MEKKFNNHFYLYTYNFDKEYNEIIKIFETSNDFKKYLLSALQPFTFTDLKSYIGTETPEGYKIGYDDPAHFTHANNVVKEYWSSKIKIVNEKGFCKCGDRTLIADYNTAGKLLGYKFI